MIKLLKVFSYATQKNQTILTTAPAPVLNGQNQIEVESSFISEDCLQRLNLKRRKRNLTTQGVEGESLAQSNGSGEITLGRDCDLKVEGAVLTKLTNAFPTVYFPARNRSSLKNVNLADPNFIILSRIDFL